LDSNVDIAPNHGRDDHAHRQVFARLVPPPRGPACYPAGPIGVLSYARPGAARRRSSVLAGAAAQGFILTALFGGMHGPVPPAAPLTVELAIVPPAPQAEAPAEPPPEAPVPVAGEPETPPPDVTPPPQAVSLPDVSPPPAARAVVTVPARPPRPRPAAHRPAVPMVTVAAASNPTTVAPSDPGSAAPAEHHIEETLRDHIRAAVQQAVRCPAAASLMGLSGKAAVAFDYRDGLLLTDAQLTRSAGASTLDSAALGAVRNARYPKPPPEEAGHTLRLLIWVEEACAGR
jgi:protein TonB